MEGAEGAEEEEEEDSVGGCPAQVGGVAQREDVGQHVARVVARQVPRVHQLPKVHLPRRCRTTPSAGSAAISRWVPP